MRVFVAFGTRPEAIKMAPVVRALKADPVNFETFVCVTAQHRGMLDQVLLTFKIKPDIDLDVMSPGQELSDLTSSLIQSVSQVVKGWRPDLILVHGDTTTAFSAALVALYLDIPVAHIEAGLRTYNLRAPFPEEFNRQVIGKIAAIHFAPTPLNLKYLVNEKIPENRIKVVGNTVIDALQLMIASIERDASKQNHIKEFLDRLLGFDWKDVRFILITGHRRENFGQGLEQICEAIAELAKKFPAVHFVYPVHLNPCVQSSVRAMLSSSSNIHLLDPLSYEYFVYLMQHCYLVLTDSGGIQEEAPSLGKPVLVMRETTEREEAVLAGTVKLVGSDKDRIVAGVSSLITNARLYFEMSSAKNPYGDGKTATAIIDHLKAI